MSSILNCAIELWRNLEIDDDELLEIAIRDVSFQIQLHKAKEEGECHTVTSHAASASATVSVTPVPPSLTSAWNAERPRFNPRVDPTVLYLEMKNLTLNLNNFLFRIEKNKKRTILDPVFEGRGMVSLQNITIRLRVECAKERVKRTKIASEVCARKSFCSFVGRNFVVVTAHPSSCCCVSFASPTCSAILRIQELCVELENLQLRVKDTGFGSDWLLNRAVHVFGESITRVVEENLRDQILEQCRAAVEHLNAYFLVHPNMILNLLGVSMDDLEEHVVFV